MKKNKLQKQIESLKESDFLEGLFDSWQIWIKNSEFSLWNQYMQCGFESEESAVKEMQKIKVQYPKMGKSIYAIEVRKVKIRMLKNPISIS